MAENGSPPLSMLAITLIATGIVAAVIVVGAVSYLYRRFTNNGENRESMADVTRYRSPSGAVKMSPKIIHGSLSRGDTYDRPDDGFNLYVVPSPTDYTPQVPSPLSLNRRSSAA
jgi:hypothetical protein